MEMRQLRGWLLRLFGLFHRKRREREFAEELESHLAFHIEDNLRAGMSPEEARRRALIKLGGVTLTQERYREQRGLPMLETLIQDLRFGLRVLRKNPAFALAAILSLAIGIGANTALFSVVNAVLWRPLPYPHAERLVRVGEWNSASAFEALKLKQRAFDGLAAWSARDFMLTGQRTPAHLKGRRTTPELLPLLGVTPQLGRAFVSEEFQPGRTQVVLISDHLWRSQFGAESQIIGQAVTLDQQRYTVVGVLPAHFDFFPADDLLTPLALTTGDIRQENYYGLGIVARLKPGLTLTQAQQEMARIAPSLEAQRNALRQQQGQQEKGEIAERFDARRELRLQPLRDLLVKDFRLTLLVLWGVSAIL
jgi:hypothetical protein